MKNDIPTPTEELKTMLSRELEFLEDLTRELEEEILSADEGHLRIFEGNNGPQLYLITKKGDTNGRYLKKEEYPLAKQLAQADYDRKLLRIAKGYQKALDNCLLQLPEKSLADVGIRSESRKALITPRFLTEEEALSAWQLQSWKQSSFAPEEKVFRARNGVLVRSKSEKIIADLLLEYDIPFRYEQEVIIAGHAVYPDFTIYDSHHRREVLLEHLGLMDNEAYASKNLRKIAAYVKAGYVYGETLLLSGETQNAPLDVEYLEALLQPLARNRE